MEHCGIDVHKKESQICVLLPEGKLEERRIATSRESLSTVFATRPRMQILIESATESEWVARHLESLGHEVIVADPNYAPMYATRSKRVKTDRRDARALAEACKLGAWRPAHRVSDQQRHVRTLLDVHQQLIQTRSRMISLARAMLRREGFRVRGGQAEHFHTRACELPLSGRLRSELGWLFSTMVHLNAQLASVDERIELATRADADVTRARSVYGVGALTAAAFVATLDGAQRFRRAHQVESYLGLVPCESSSGEKQRRGHITKVGDRRIRALLVQAAWCIVRSKRREVEHLKHWCAQIAARRGKNVAVVALARKLAGILFALLRDGTTYHPPAELQAAA